MAESLDTGNIKKNIENLHVGGWRGIVRILTKLRILLKWPFWTCLLTSIFLTVFSTFITNKSFPILQYLTDLIINVFPDLIGFSLGGYAIVVSFGNAELIKKATKTDGYSIYQVISAIFSLIILCQVFTLFFAFLTSWSIKFELGSPFGYLPVLYTLVNSSLLLMLSFGATYSLAMSSYIVVNLFTLSQDNNKFYTLEKYEQEQRDDEVAD